ncbi:Hypothetical predicted protein [Pelobates cultripes]|uniref:Uncharacterized protein n=1 Tax=Pelobates cultripes TaxID=61616 RepID=A0AAD1T455_PELCU|nr:Hypothetical predicted protein [Pelobates cultripes]
MADFRGMLPARSRRPFSSARACARAPAGRKEPPLQEETPESPGYTRKPRAGTPTAPRAHPETETGPHGAPDHPETETGPHGAPDHPETETGSDLPPGGRTEPGRRERERERTRDF